MTATTITFYLLIKFVHVAVVVVALGATYSYPFLHAIGQRSYPRSLPYLYRVEERIGKTLVIPGMLVLLAAGIYLVAKGPYSFSDSWVSVGFAALVILILMGGLFFSPLEAKLAEIAERDVTASGGGEVKFSAEHDRLAHRLDMGGRLAGLLILVGTFFMVVKP